MKLLAFITAFIAGPAAAQNCLPFDAMREGLSLGFGETVQFQGLRSGELVQFYANTESGTWTIVVTTPDGKSCIVVDGSEYQFIGAPSGAPA